MHSVFFSLWGDKTHAAFDVWSIEHVLSGLSVGRAVNARNRAVFQKLLGSDHQLHSRYFDITGVLFWAYLWETLEHYLETGLLGPRVSFWLQGVEFWANRILADPLLLVLGYLIARRWPGLVLPARVLSILWLSVHIFAFPDSMYLQRLLFGS